ncbi:tryptophan synthase beta subunit-like PLP-dependent enzyme [Lepidopterella palustris CBS 459.81]|uniref:Tryptophan synthase beta subunit-like PLP-dependent enzyme n=1 Tax=Lepidopterella palustris CBS 459.81 TaxID=1314670 RepID=A0A8E2E8Z1_9PEZI|nr:tryptophan synthase beta subunit-like PLP-dependent enzyme [Lepidopterella palustris CBS 459.81]
MYFNPSAGSCTFNYSTNHAVEDFHRLLPDYNSTPLVSLPELAQELGLGHVLIKDESHRFSLPAFKILGASWAIYKAIAAKGGLPAQCSLEELGEFAKDKKVKLVTCSEGNWGRAVARMGKHLHVPTTIFVPKYMDQATQDKITSEGAAVRVVPGDYDLSIKASREEADCTDSLLVMDTSWPGYEEIPTWVVEGYSTMLTETDRQVQDKTGKAATHAIASVGVGSWAQAVALHYKGQTSRAFVVTVEPDTAASLKTSLEAGRVTPIVTGDTIMCGMNCGTISTVAWPVLRDGVDASVAIEDIEAHESVQYLHKRGVMCGPCGAAPLSALRRICKEKALMLGAESIVVLFSTEGARAYVAPRP